MALDSTTGLAGGRPADAPRAGWRARLGTLVRAVPLSLALLMAVGLIGGLAWCIVLPPLQGPDEVSHFAYVQKIVETGSIPWRAGEPAHPGHAYSTEVNVAGLCSGVSGLAQNLAARAPASTVDEQACYAALNRLPPGARGDGGYTSAEKNPPLYYLYESIPYAIVHNATFFTRSFAMRLANLPLLLALVVFTWLLSGELLLGLPRGPALRALATAAVALNPQLTMMTATINPDVLLAMLWTAGLWLSVSILRHGLTPARAGWLVGVCVLAAFTQGRGLPLIPVAGLTLVVAAWRLRRPTGYRAATAAGLIGIVALLGAFLLVRYAVKDDLTLDRVRGFGSYMWQFYLPRLGFMAPSIHPGYGIRQVFVDRFLGTFAQLEVSFSSTTLDFLSRVAEFLALAALIGIAVRWRRLAKAPWVVAVLAVGALGYLALLHAVAYSSLLTLPGDPIITGRYLLPLLSLYGVGVALAVSWLPRALSAVLSGALAAGLIVLQLSALTVLLERFYA
ncbi:MAG: hypothetical protein ACRDK4_15735 [Solirubrobacteraceae bacterium]